MGNRVARIRTEVSEPQMAQAITEGWQELFKTQPSKEQVSMILAQNALETGNRKSMWNNNIGNITTNGKDKYDFFDDLKTSEQLKPGVWKKMNLKYRSYPFLKEGVKDYLRFLNNKRYSEAWKHIVNPNPVAFSKALKKAGYYTANEEPYTKSIVKLFNQFSNKNNMLLNQSPPMNDNSLSNILDNYLQMVAASEKTNRKIYKKLLPTNKMVIKINSSDYNNSIEFSRILCSALEEELMAKAYTHTNGENIEIECAISGPIEDCFKTIKQLTASIVDTFKTATIKIGGVKINTLCIMNKKSSYNQIGFKSAESQHRKFLLKFI